MVGRKIDSTGNAEASTIAAVEIGIRHHPVILSPCSQITIQSLLTGNLSQRGLLDDCDAAASVAPEAGELLALANVGDGGRFEARAFLFGFEQGGVVF